ncbi:MAG: carboxylate-amine ligase, partial [Deltaproteobacteria bacterium]|nr:carboxylate-amine ligase [Deltaproteobacteria bacterium]
MELPRWPTLGSQEEKDTYAALQARMPELFRVLTADPREPQTVVIIPSLSMDPRELRKISGVWHYEERMLVN